MNKISVSCIQMNAGPDVGPNLKTAGDLIREAAKAGAQLILTPENTCSMVSDRAKKLATSKPMDQHPAIPFFASLAKELSVSIIVGSIAVQVSETKLANRSLCFSGEGVLLDFYDKIHLFDVDLPTGERHRESDIFEAGQRLVLTEGFGAKIGMSICYDVRFPNLYRSLAQRGAQILSIPAAFTVPTGQAHWEVLLRARAIETGSFVMAAAQTGTHDGGRKTWGHSMIINPWGEIVAEAGQDVGWITAEMDLAEVVAARGAIPALLDALSLDAYSREVVSRLEV